MSSVSALFGAATRLASAGRRGNLHPSVSVEGGAEGVPASTTLLVGGEDPGLAADPVLAGWFARMTGMLSGRDTIDLPEPGRLGGAPVWPILGHGEGSFDATLLAGAIPVGAAWVAALHPDRFFAQAAERLDARGDSRGAEWAARLRTPTGNLALLGRLVTTMAISLDTSGAPVLRLRIGCPDEGAARQALLALHAWRVRRGMGDGAAGAAFRGSDLVRADRRVELSLWGDLSTLIGLFGR
jgi:hypothetical protein